MTREDYLYEAWYFVFAVLIGVIIGLWLAEWMVTKA